MKRVEAIKWYKWQMKRKQIVNILLSSWLTHMNTYFVSEELKICIKYTRMRIAWTLSLSLTFMYRILVVLNIEIYVYKVASDCSHFMTSYRIIINIIIIIDLLIFLFENF